MSYRLRAGVTFCRVGDRFVFLDLPRDRYFCLAPKAERAFDRLLQDELPDCGPADLRALVDDGLIFEARGADRPYPCIALCPPERSLLDAQSVPRARETVEALLAHQAARLRLKTLGLDHVLRRAAIQTKAPKSGQTVGAAGAVASALARAAMIISTRNQCLSTSLAAMKLLRRRGLAGILVLGVKLRPFQAHCWVQIGADLVTDRVDVVRNFTAIKVV